MGHGKLSEVMVGSWELTVREDRRADGTLVPEPGLGPNPKGLLIYDGCGNFAAQFMKRDRSNPDPAVEAGGKSGANNTRATGGYDAYFGKYSVDDERREVTQELLGALSPENVGHVVTRVLEIDGDELTIRLPTTAMNGEPVDRLLKWRRIG